MSDLISSNDAVRPLRREGSTWVLYALTLIFGFGIATLGPAMPLLRGALDMSRTVGGAHFTVLAVGSVAAGMTAHRAVVAVGRSRLFWLGGAGVVLALAVIGMTINPTISILGAFLLGVAATTMITVAQAAVVELHPRHQTTVITELNLASALGTMLPAMALGAVVALGIDWRAALFLPMAFLVPLRVIGRRTTIPEPAPQTQSEGHSPLPLSYWVMWATFIPAVSAEWSVGAWGAGFLIHVADIPGATASLLMTGFFGMMALGRFIGSRLAIRIAPFPMLLTVSAVGFLGAALLSSATSLTAAVAGLLVTGLGTSMLFPLVFSLNLAVLPDKPDLVSARAFVSGGIAVLTAPLALGAIADRFDLRTAIGIVPVLFVLVAMLATVGHRSATAARR